MTFQKKGHIPLKREMIKDTGQYFGDLKKNLPSTEPLSQFKLNLVKTSLHKGNSFLFTRKGPIVFQKGHNGGGFKKIKI